MYSPFGLTDIYQVKIPRQTNLYDCAMYLLTTVLMLSQPSKYPVGKGDCKTWYTKTAIPALRLWFTAYVLCCGEGLARHPDTGTDRVASGAIGQESRTKECENGNPSAESRGSSDLEIISD